MANIITSCRILCSILLLFVPAFSPMFYIFANCKCKLRIISEYIVQKKFAAKHTLMNKVTGVVLFILPLTLSIVDLKYSGGFVCTIAILAAVQEGHLIRTENHKFKRS